MIGYNPEKVVELGEEIVSACDNVMKIIVNILQTDLINPISQAWYTPEGKAYFDSFAKHVKNLRLGVYQTFLSFKNSIQTTADEWAKLSVGNSGLEAPTVNLASLNFPDAELDVSVILDKREDGDIGIDVDKAQTVANGLGTAQQSITNGINAIAQSVTASAAFLGGGQSAAINSCFTSINTAVSDVFKILTEGNGESQSISEAIKIASANHTNFGAEVSSAFGDAKSDAQAARTAAQTGQSAQ